MQELPLRATIVNAPVAILGTFRRRCDGVEWERSLCRVVMPISLFSFDRRVIDGCLLMVRVFVPYQQYVV